MSELDRRVQEDGRNEAARALDERRIVEIDECGVLAAECVDQDRTGGAESSVAEVRGPGPKVAPFARCEVSVLGAPSVLRNAIERSPDGPEA